MEKVPVHQPVVRVRYVTPIYSTLWATRAAFPGGYWSLALSRWGNVNKAGDLTLPTKEIAVDNTNKAPKLHIQKELGYEDLKTLRSAIADDSKEGGKTPRPLPSFCTGTCTK